jgi:hypothetical protein
MSKSAANEKATSMMWLFYQFVRVWVFYCGRCIGIVLAITRSMCGRAKFGAARNRLNSAIHSQLAEDIFDVGFNGIFFTA